MKYEKTLLDSFFIRFDNYVNCYQTDLEKRILLKHYIRVFFNTQNVESYFNTPTNQIYSVLLKSL